MVKGTFKEGELMAPYKIFYENGEVFLEKNNKKEYIKFSNEGEIILKVLPIECEKETKFSRASNSRGIEEGVYQCFKLVNISKSEENIEKNISIRPFLSNVHGNCLKPTYVCEGISPSLFKNFFD